jgi:hypothetical protein
LKAVVVKTACIEPGSPWENGYCESFNGKMRDGFLNREVFDTMFEVEVLTRKWILEYNTVRSHSALGYRPPAPEVILAASKTNLESGTKNGGCSLKFLCISHYFIP